MTIFLRFPDQATFVSLMPKGAQPVGETYDLLPAGVTAISVIGTIYTGGTYDTQGNVITAPVLVPGFHVNALGTVPDSWVSYVITPVNNPVRVFG